MLGIVINVYKNFDTTVKFVNEELAKISVPWKAVIVDNASSPELSFALASACGGSLASDKLQKDVVVISVKDNLGYAKGNNLGAKYLLDNYACDYLLFTNDDIIINGSEVVPTLLERFHKDENIAVVGPRVVGLDGAEQSPHYRVITPERQLGWRFLSFLRRKRPVAAGNIEKPSSGYCYWVSGAFFIMKSADFVAVDGFDSATFLYAEEVILSERLKQRLGGGEKEYFCSDCYVTHCGGCSTAALQSETLKKYLKESNCHYYRKYLHSCALSVWLYKIFC